MGLPLRLLHAGRRELHDPRARGRDERRRHAHAAQPRRAPARTRTRGHVSAAPSLLARLCDVALRLACGSLAGLRTLPADLSYDACLEESQTVMFDVAEKAMAAAKVTPREVRRPTHL